MKKFYLLFGFLIYGAILRAQTNTFPANGNVGIGTLSPESGWLLDVNGLGAIGTKYSSRIYMGTFDSTSAFIQSRNSSIAQKLKFFASSYYFDTGNVGIGTKLHLKNSLSTERSAHKR